VYSLSGLLLSVALFIPMGIDGIGQALGYWKSTNPRRLITGLCGGTAQTILTMVIAGLLLRLF
jgi:uncharacterized membrane protein